MSKSGWRHGKVEETQFLEKSFKKVSIKQKKGRVCDLNREPTFQTCWERYDEYFVFGSLHLDERVRKNAHFAMIIGNHFTNVISWQVNTFWRVFPYGKHYSQTRNIEQQQNTILTFGEFLKGAKKRFQEAKMRGAHEEKRTLSSQMLKDSRNVVAVVHMCMMSLTNYFFFSKLVVLL